MTNNERFNAMLNNCQNPRAVYLALLSLAGTGNLDKLREGQRPVTIIMASGCRPQPPPVVGAHHVKNETKRRKYS